MPYSQKYCLVAFVNPVDVGFEFDVADWPLHITLADVFAIDRLDTNIEEKLKTLLDKLRPVETKAEKETILVTTPVVLLERSSGLVKLHNLLIDLLEANGAKFNNPEFTRNSFIPHSAIQKSEHIKKDTTLMIDTIYLIDMFPGYNWQQRKVLAAFKLQGKQP